MFKIYDGRQLFYQWDLNRKLLVEDSSITQVHFSNQNRGTALVLEVYELDGHRVVDVPNILLQDDRPLYAYAYLDDHTKLTVTFTVRSRPKPEEYEYTETEVLTFSKMMERAEEAANAADESAGNAADSEQAAKTAAESADQSAKAAAESAKKAEQAAGNVKDGASAYEVAVANGFEGTEAEWLESLIGPQGATGATGATGKDGTDGKSAYEYAVQGGYAGTEEEFAALLAEGGGGVNVTAEVGQTILVEEIDESGKPTKWKAVDYQPRTHWEEGVVFFPETTLEDEGGGLYLLAESALPFVAGEEYIVNFNGTEYTVECVDMSDAVGGAPAKAFALGSIEFPPPEGEPPFVIMAFENVPDQEDMTAVMAGSDYEGQPITFGIKQIQTVKIPAKYYDKVFYIDVTKNEDETYSTLNTPEEVNAAYESAIPIFLRLDNDGQIVFGLLMARQPYFASGRYQYIFNFDFLDELYYFSVSDNNNGGFSVYGASATFASQIDARLKELGLIT